MKKVKVLERMHRKRREDTVSENREKNSGGQGFLPLTTIEKPKSGDRRQDICRKRGTEKEGKEGKYGGGAGDG